MNNNLHTPSALRARPPDSEGQSVTIASNFLHLRQGEYHEVGRGWIKLKGENGKLQVRKVGTRHAVSETNTKRTIKLLMRTPSIPSLGHTQFPNGETPVLSREDYNTPTGAQAQYHRVGTPVLTRRYSSTDTMVLQYRLRSTETGTGRHWRDDRETEQKHCRDTARRVRKTELPYQADGHGMPCPYNEQNNTLTNN